MKNFWERIRVFLIRNLGGMDRKAILADDRSLRATVNRVEPVKVGCEMWIGCESVRCSKDVGLARKMLIQKLADEMECEGVIRVDMSWDIRTNSIILRASVLTVPQ